MATSPISNVQSISYNKGTDKLDVLRTTGGSKETIDITTGATLSIKRISTGVFELHFQEGTEVADGDIMYEKTILKSQIDSIKSVEDNEIWVLKIIGEQDIRDGFKLNEPNDFYIGINHQFPLMSIRSKYNTNYIRFRKSR